MTTAETVLDIVATVLCVKRQDINETTLFESIAPEEIDREEVAGACEIEFSIDISPGDIDGWIEIQDLIRFVESKTKG